MVPHVVFPNPPRYIPPSRVIYFPSPFTDREDEREGVYNSAADRLSTRAHLLWELTELLSQLFSVLSREEAASPLRREIFLEYIWNKNISPLFSSFLCVSSNCFLESRTFLEDLTQSFYRIIGSWHPKHVARSISPQVILKFCFSRECQLHLVIQWQKGASMRQGKTISSCFFQSCDVDIFRGPTTHIGGIWRDRQRFDDFSVHGGSGKEVFFFYQNAWPVNDFKSPH